MQKFVKVWTAGTLTAVMLLCASCGSSPIAKTLFVQAIGVDQKDDGFAVAVQAFDPSQGGGGEEGANVSTTFIESEGETVLSGFNNMTRQVGRRPFYAQNRVIILGEDLSKSGILNVMDVFSRSKDSRPMIDIFVSHGEAVEAVGSKMEDSVNPAEKMQLLVEGGQSNGAMPRVQVLDVQKALLDPYTDLLLPAVRMEQSQGEEDSQDMIMDSTALFQNDTLVDYLDMEETRGVLWINGQVKDGLVSFSTEDLGNVTLAVQESDSKIDVQGTEDGPVFSIAVTAKANIQEINLTSTFYLDDGQIDKLEQGFAEKVSGQMELAINKVLREKQCDVFQFARLLMHKDTDYWQTIQDDWREQLSKAKVKINVQCEIERMGKLSNIQEEEPYN